MINQPEATVSAPKKEQEALEKIKTDIALHEQKVRRLQDASRTLTSEMQATLEEKDKITSTVGTLQAEKDSLEKEIKARRAVLDGFVEGIAEAKKTHDELLRKNTVEEVRLSNREIDVAKKEEYFDSASKDLSNRKEEFDGERNAFSIKVKRIREAVNDL